MSMMIWLSRSKSIPQLLASRSVLRLKDIMPPSSPTARPELAKLTRWRGSSTIYTIMIEGSSPVPSKTYSNTSKAAKMRKPNLWSEPLISKFITKSSAISSGTRRITYKSDKMPEKVFMWKESRSGLLLNHRR